MYHIDDVRNWREVQINATSVGTVVEPWEYT